MNTITELDDIKLLERNFRDHNYAFFLNTKIESARILYTKPSGIFANTQDQTVQDIQSRLVREIEKEEDCRSFVVLGDSGSGKTSLALHLCNEFWKTLSLNSYKNNENLYVPIYISLRQIELKADCEEILSTFCEISQGNIKVANLSNYNLLLFLDGYDELAEKINLWEHNNWWLPRHKKKIKTVTFCKSFGMTDSELERCFTFGDNEKSKFIYIEAFGIVEIDDYLRKSVAFLKSVSTNNENVKNEPWFMTKEVTRTNVKWENDTGEYEKWLKTTFPDLTKLAANPQLLTIIIQILPGIVEKTKQSVNDLSENEQERAVRVRCATEVGIYDEFVSQWFQYQAIKNRETKSNPAFIKIPLHHVAGFMLAYAQNLAFSLAQKNGGFAGDGTIYEADSNLWHLWKPYHNQELLKLVDENGNYLIFPKDEHDNDKDRRCNFTSLRNACFLSSPTADTFKFFHSSLVEYLASREVFENVRGRFNFYLNSDDPMYDNEFGINVNDIRDNYPLLKNLAQRAATNESFKNLLFDIIEKSKEIFILRRMSANAMTILSFAGIILSGRSFENVQVPGADLSRSYFANSNFQFANLSGANFKQTSMVGCDFQGANLDKVNFDQNCSVNLGSDSDSVIGIVEDGKNTFFICYENGKVLSYTLGNEIVEEIKCGTDGVTQAEQFLYVEDGVLLIHKRYHKSENPNSARAEFAPLSTSLTVNVSNFNFNEQMDSIIVDNPMPTTVPIPLIRSKYWISKEFLDSSTKPEEQLFLNETSDKETFYYYEIKSYRKGNVGVVVLWGCVVEEKTKIEYREPQILKTFQIKTIEADQTLFRLYSDFPIFCCDIYDNKLVAIQGVNFVTIFSVTPIENLIFKVNFAIDSHYIDNGVIKFSSNGRYLIYKSDFIYLCSINHAKVQSTMKLLEVHPDNVTDFFVVFDKSCNTTAFSYDDTIFICQLPNGKIIQKMYTQNGPVFSLFPTFAFIDHTTENAKLFCFVSGNSDQNSLETITISNANESVSHRKFKDLGTFCVSNDNRRVATYYTIYSKRDDNETNILSVFETPIRTQSLLFQKEIQSPRINGMLFTQNYLLVIVNDNADVLVMDMKGNSYQSIKFPIVKILTKFISSKYQQIVLRTWLRHAEGIDKQTLQLCNIVEIGTDNGRVAPVAFKNQYDELSLNVRLRTLAFDSRDGSHILIEQGTDYRNVFLWVPATNVFLQLSKSPDPFISISNFYMLGEKSKRKICIATGYGYYFIPIPSNKSAKMQKYHHECKNSMSRFYLNVNWYVFVQNDNKLFIYCLKNNDCLAELLLPHAVTDFNLHFECDSRGDILESVDILVWDSFRNISSLSIDDINLRIADGSPTQAMLHKWKLNWTVESNSVLNFQNAIIAKSFKVNESTKRLLKNFNVNSAVGEPWPERYKYLSLSELYMPITEIETKYAIINTADGHRPRMLISADDWVVSAVAMNSNPNTSNIVHIEHVGLLIEGINNGRHFAMEADLIKDASNVRIRLLPISEKSRLDELKNKCIAMQWMKTKSDVKKLIRSIQNDQLIDGEKYNIMRKNCATWCKEKLKEIDIEKFQNGWYRKIILFDLPSDLFQIKDKIVKVRLPFNPSA